jgi:RNA polymerase sigma-70 factor (ECF subfamily)
MAAIQQHWLTRFLRQTVFGRGGGVTDGQLLQRFLAQKDEAAFTELVNRHGPMVLGVCRRVLGNSADAEDAFQATFLVLVRRAGALAARPVLGDWLHGVAHRTALKARAALARRRAKEQALARPEAQGEETRNDWLPLLDEALSRLPEKYRLPLVLCDLEGRTRREAAEQLGWPEGTVAGRQARGRALLARRLLRSVQVLSGALPAALGTNAVQAALPPALLGSTVQAATLVAAGQMTAQGVLSAQALTLVKGVLQAMLLTRIKIGLTILAVVLLCGGGIAAYGIGKGHPPQAREQESRPAVAPPQDRKKEQADAAGKLLGTWRLVLVEDEGLRLSEGRPEIKDARVIFDDRTMTILDVQDGKEKRAVLRYRLDTTTTPWQIELAEQKDQAELRPGICEIKGDTLTLCTSKVGRRPKEFTAPVGSKQNLQVLKRVESPKPRVAPPEKPEEEETLQQALLKLDAMRNGPKVDYPAVEKRGQELLARWTQPEDQARIYFMLAHVYGQTGIDRNFSPVMKYARLALPNERDPVQRARLFMYLGCAATIDPDAGLRDLPVKRRRATAAYLEGYKEVLALKLPEKVPELPQRAVDNAEEPSPRFWETWLRRYRTAMWLKAREEAEYVRSMHFYRDILIRQIVELYQREPKDDEELRRLACEALDDPRAVEDLLARVRQK